MSRPASSGFTLLETVVAMSVLAIALMSILGSMVNAHNITKQAESEALALEEVENLIEWFQTIPYEDVLSYNGQGFGVHPLEPPAGREVIQVGVTNIGTGYEMTFDVEWKDGAGWHQLRIVYFHIERGA